MSQFVSIFRNLLGPSENQNGETIYNGLEVENHRGCHICKDQLNRPAILFATAPTSSRQQPSIFIENLHVEHNIPCQLVRTDGSLIEGQFSVVSCLNADIALQDYFLDIMEVITSSLPAVSSAEDIANAVEKLIELFQAFKRAPRNSVMGLWAELFLILSASNPLSMIQAWHSDASERFDFSAGLQRIEVKSSGDRVRSHHFSFEQAYPPEGVDVIVASLFAESSTSGRTLGDLWDEARDIAGLNMEMRMKIEKLCMDSLGESWSAARSRSFDFQLAEQSLFFYRVIDIPRVSTPQSSEVSDIHFRSDISTTRPISAEFYRGIDPLFSAYFGDSDK
jgi:hypothetical protein